jgi:hypothetical protein
MKSCHSIFSLFALVPLVEADLAAGAFSAYGATLLEVDLSSSPPLKQTMNINPRHGERRTAATSKYLTIGGTIVRLAFLKALSINLVIS